MILRVQVVVHAGNSLSDHEVLFVCADAGPELRRALRRLLPQWVIGYTAGSVVMSAQMTDSLSMLVRIKYRTDWWEFRLLEFNNWFPKADSLWNVPNLQILIASYQLFSLVASSTFRSSSPSSAAFKRRKTISHSEAFTGIRRWISCSRILELLWPTDMMRIYGNIYRTVCLVVFVLVAMKCSPWLMISLTVVHLSTCPWPGMSIHVFFVGQLKY